MYFTTYLPASHPLLHSTLSTNPIAISGRMLVDLAAVVPDGIICFFVSYSYMDSIVSRWNDMGILSALMTHKLVFIETVDVVETTLALDNYRRACDCGRGAIFFRCMTVVQGVKWAAPIAKAARRSGLCGPRGLGGNGPCSCTSLLYACCPGPARLLPLSPFQSSLTPMQCGEGQGGGGHRL